MRSFPRGLSSRFEDLVDVCCLTAGREDRRLRFWSSRPMIWSVFFLGRKGPQWKISLRFVYMEVLRQAIDGVFACYAPKWTLTTIW